jgi:hypothetical protein
MAMRLWPPRCGDITPRCGARSRIKFGSNAITRAVSSGKRAMFEQTQETPMCSKTYRVLPMRPSTKGNAPALNITLIQPFVGPTVLFEVKGK